MYNPQTPKYMHPIYFLFKYSCINTYIKLANARKYVIYTYNISQIDFNAN